MKLYTIQVLDGSEFKVVAMNKYFAQLKVYLKYKKTRNTSFSKFKKNIVNLESIDRRNIIH